jgi:hypothetical protein
MTRNKTAAVPIRGRGRPKLEETGAHVITLRLTSRQKETFDLVGRSHWLRSELEQLRAELDQVENNR